MLGIIGLIILWIALGVYALYLDVEVWGQTSEATFVDVALASLTGPLIMCSVLFEHYLIGKNRIVFKSPAMRELERKRRERGYVS